MVRIQHLHQAAARCVLFALLFAWCASDCGSAKGQESDKVLRSTTGHLLVGRRGGGIEAIQLPTLRTTTVRRASAPNPIDFPSIHALSGPDSEGRIAYIEDHGFVSRAEEKRHLLKTIRLDGTKDTVLFSRPGDAMWAATLIGKGQIGGRLALSPVGARVAFHTDLVGVQMPGTYLHVGAIEIWNIDTKQSVKRDVGAINASLAWFPDGKRLAYVKFVDPRDVAVTPDDAFRRKHSNWEKVPAVTVWNVDTGTESVLRTGWEHRISEDGQFVLISDSDSEWVRLDLATGRSSHVTWQGAADAHSGLIASPARDVVLASTVRFQPAPKRRGLFSSMDPPTRIKTFGLAKLNTDEFDSISTFEDSLAASFGRVRER